MSEGPADSARAADLAAAPDAKPSGTPAEREEPSVLDRGAALPHCRYQSPEWLSDTIRRLLEDYEAGGSKLPFFREAMLVIDEHCGIDGRHIFDQDNKGWKAVSNAIKGRLVPDDDQFTLAVALISEKSEMNVCHITLLDMVDVADFFATRSGDYAVPDFYDGGWE